MPKPRRTRYVFSATTRHGEFKQGHILAHSREGAERTLTDYHGMRDVSVDVLQRASGRPARWEVDQHGLARAIDALGIKWRVEVRRTSALDAVGRYRWSPLSLRQRVHRITVDKLETPLRASEVILHELTHAAQTEAAYNAGGEAAVDNYYKRMFRMPYAKRPMEIEAKANETLGHIYLPARKASR